MKIHNSGIEGAHACLPFVDEKLWLKEWANVIFNLVFKVIWAFSKCRTIISLFKFFNIELKEHTL